MSTPDLMTLARKAVQVEVSLLRTPLLLTDQIATRLGAGPAVHSKVRQGLAALDAVADRVADAPARSASERTPRAEPAPRAEPTPAATEVAPDETPVSESREDLVEHVTEELLAEEELAPLAGELAESDELRRVQAELNAKRLVAEQDEQHSE